MVRQLFLTVGLILIATSAFGQDPQAVMNMLLQRQMERYQLQQQLERQELEEKLRLRQASDEAMRRGLLQYSPWEKATQRSIVSERHQLSPFLKFH